MIVQLGMSIFFLPHAIHFHAQIKAFVCCAFNYELFEKLGGCAAAGLPSFQSTASASEKKTKENKSKKKEGLLFFCQQRM